MKALSVKQPYADKIIFRGKDIENRTRRTNFRGLAAIHASKKIHPYAELSDKQKKKLVLGAIIGVVEVVDCVEKHKSKWLTVRSDTC